MNNRETRAGLRLLVLRGAIALLALFIYNSLPRAPKATLELCGTYLLDCELVREELILRSDGTFSQTVIIKATSEKVSAAGTWSYATSTKHGLVFGDVTIDGFVKVLKWPHELEPDYARPQPGIAVLPAEYWFGRLVLGGRVDSWPDRIKVK